MQVLSLIFCRLFLQYFTQINLNRKLDDEKDKLMEKLI